MSNAHPWFQLLDVIEEIQQARAALRRAQAAYAVSRGARRLRWLSRVQCLRLALIRARLAVVELEAELVRQGLLRA